MSTVAAAHAGIPADSEISEQATRNAAPARRQAAPPAAGESTSRLARTWNRTGHGLVVGEITCRPGRITLLSSAESLASVAGVTRVSMKAGVGDVVGPRLITTSTTGLVLPES
ncbi:hypothetical protein [Streptomyces hainanensis]|uniref:hypothetical protein n=1 Tax=Streptomyces hainanensis TaxID=402648 RepID=UPI001404A8F5|nr:hypothetical protein [Streptomyces hainanensis]